MNIINEAKNALATQINGLSDILPVLDENFAKIVEIIANCQGHIIVSGVGKSGNVATKIASTMSSIGIPAFFLDPFNAGHGDMGMITPHDVIIFLSNSGESSEIMSVLNYAKGNGNVTISITRDAKSTISTNADFTISLPKSLEASDLMAPTTSTTQTLVAGDCLAVCASKLKNFTKEQYAKLHPSGVLGMKIAKITTIINTELPIVDKNANLKAVLQEMSQNSSGFTCVVNSGKLCGIVTDGDIRRFILKSDGEISNAKAMDICNKSPKFLRENAYIFDAIEIMKANRIAIVVVVDVNSKPIGFVARNQFDI